MTNSTTDGLGFGEVNQNVTSTEMISGTKVFATNYIGTAGSIIAQGIIYSSDNVYAKGNILSPIGTGSPSTSWGAAIQTGTNVTSAGSLVWIAFPTAFKAAPTVIVSDTGAHAGLATGSVSTGSFVTYSIGAAKTFNWFAAGSL